MTFNYSDIVSGVAELRRYDYEPDLLLLGPDAYADLLGDPRYDESDEHEGIGKLEGYDVVRFPVDERLSSGGIVLGVNDSGAWEAEVITSE